MALKPSDFCNIGVYLLRESLIVLEALLKILLGFKVKAGLSVQPEEYTKYFED